MLTVAQLIDQVQQLANRVDTSYRGRVRESISRAQDAWALEHPWEGLRRRENFVTPGGRYMIFPSRVRALFALSDITDKRALDYGAIEFDRGWEGEYQNDTSGAPFEYRDAGIVPFVAAPATDTRLEIRSTVSESFTVYVSGLARDTAASGTALEFYEVEETMQMGGSGPTNTTTTFYDVRTLTKEAGTLGDLIVKTVTGGAYLARIQARDARSAYKRVEFQHVPAAGRVLRAAYFTRPDPIRDEDQAIEPSVDENFLLWRAVGDLHWINKEAQAATVAWAKADKVLFDNTAAEKGHGEMKIVPMPWYGYNAHEDAEGYYW